MFLLKVSVDPEKNNELLQIVNGNKNSLEISWNVILSKNQEIICNFQ